MSQPINVYLDAMTRYAEAAETVSEGMQGAYRGLIDADVTEDSFGLLPESRDAHAMYDQRCTDGLDVLTAGRDVFSDLGGAFRQMRDNYRSSDASSASQSAGVR